MNARRYTAEAPLHHRSKELTADHLDERQDERAENRRTRSLRLSHQIVDRSTFDRATPRTFDDRCRSGGSL
jgi:hypothetical protein